MEGDCNVYAHSSLWMRPTGEWSINAKMVYWAHSTAQINPGVYCVKKKLHQIIDVSLWAEYTEWQIPWCFNPVSHEYLSYINITQVILIFHKCSVRPEKILQWCSEVEEEVQRFKRQGKPQKNIRFFFYCVWARHLKAGVWLWKWINAFSIQPLFKVSSITFPRVNELNMAF